MTSGCMQALMLQRVGFASFDSPFCSASWRMPTTSQMQKLAAAPAVGRNGPVTPAPGPADATPPQYWDSILNDPRADARPAGKPIQSGRSYNDSRVFRRHQFRCVKTALPDRLLATRVHKQIV